MLHCVWGPALHSPVAPITARILSSNAGERHPRANAKCENCWQNLAKLFFAGLSIYIHTDKYIPDFVTCLMPFVSVFFFVSFKWGK